MPPMSNGTGLREERLLQGDDGLNCSRNALVDVHTNRDWASKTLPNCYFAIESEVAIMVVQKNTWSADPECWDTFFLTFFRKNPLKFELNPKGKPQQKESDTRHNHRCNEPQYSFISLLSFTALKWTHLILTQ